MDESVLTNKLFEISKYTWFILIILIKRVENVDYDIGFDIRSWFVYLKSGWIMKKTNNVKVKNISHL